MKNKKYELAKDDTTIFYNDTMYRIRALKDFGAVKKGDLGGYIQSEDNLSQEGNCWIYDDAIVANDARVSDNAEVYDNATVYGHAVIRDNAMLHNYAKVYQYAVVSDDAEVFGISTMMGDSKLSGEARLYDNSILMEFAKVSGKAHLFDTDVSGHAKMHNVYSYNVKLRSDAVVTTLTDLDSDMYRISNVTIGKKGYITSPSDCITIGHIGGEADNITLYYTIDNKIYIADDYYNKSVKKFKKLLNKHYELDLISSTYREQYLKAIKFAKSILKQKKDVSEFER